MTSSGCVETVYNFYPHKCCDIIILLKVIKVIGDGSCFFHSILRAIYKPYISATSNSSRIKIVREFRQAIATELETKDPATNKIAYDQLGNGSYAEFNRSISNVVGDMYSLKALKRELLSSSPVDHVYIQLISDHLNIDIFLISSITNDLYFTGTEIKLLYKKRNAIVILYSPGHYDIIGVKRKTSDNRIVFDCFFHKDHVFIECLYNRLNSIVKE